MYICNIRFARLLLLLFGFLVAVESAAAPRAELWPYWLKTAEAGGQPISHQPWQVFLSAHVERDSSGMNRVSYADVSQAQKVDLDEYLQHLSEVSISGYPRDEQLAFWINLYNALTVKVILDHYPVKSIKDIKISPGWFSSGPWGKKLVTLEGHALSLDDIEHRILRPIWKDPRIHYAVNCASIGCPNLGEKAFSAASVESELDRAARDYINHPRGVTPENDRARVSSIYQWFEDDFGGSKTSVLEHIRRYASVELLDRLEKVSDISGYQYDWALNERANN